MSCMQDYLICTRIQFSYLLTANRLAEKGSLETAEITRNVRENATCQPKLKN